MSYKNTSQTKYTIDTVGIKHFKCPIPTCSSCVPMVPANIAAHLITSHKQLATMMHLIERPANTAYAFFCESCQSYANKPHFTCHECVNSDCASTIRCFLSKDALDYHLRKDHTKWWFEHSCNYGKKCHGLYGGCGFVHHEIPQRYITLSKPLPKYLCRFERPWEGVRCNRDVCSFAHLWGRVRFLIKSRATNANKHVKSSDLSTDLSDYLSADLPTDLPADLPADLPTDLPADLPVSTQNKFIELDEVVVHQNPAETTPWSYKGYSNKHNCFDCPDCSHYNTCQHCKDCSLDDDDLSYDDDWSPPVIIPQFRADPKPNINWDLVQPKHVQDDCEELDEDYTDDDSDWCGVSVCDYRPPRYDLSEDDDFSDDDLSDHIVIPQFRADPKPNINWDLVQPEHDEDDSDELDEEYLDYDYQMSVRCESNKRRKDTRQKQSPDTAQHARIQKQSSDTAQRARIQKQHQICARNRTQIINTCRNTKKIVHE